MATRTDEELAREAFKQELLHASSWALRRMATGPSGAGVKIDDMREAEASGPTEVVELIMEKYDEGWRSGGKNLNTASVDTDSSEKKVRTKKAKKEEEAPPDDADADGTDPWEAFGSDDPLNLDGDSGPEEGAAQEPKQELEPEPEQQKTRRARRSSTSEVVEVSAVEEKVDKILDTLMRIAPAIAKLEKAMNETNDTVEKVRYSVIETREIAAVAFGAVFGRLSLPDYKKLVLRATTIAKKACGIKE